MTSATAAALIREILDRPRDRDFVELYEVWLRKRGLRRMPSWGDFDLSAFPHLSRHLELYDVGSMEGMYTVRFMGSAIVEFIGRDNTGKPAGYGLPEGTAKSIVGGLDAVVRRSAPMFLRGRVLWIAGKTHRRFEACAFPLSDNGATVNVVLSALKLQ